MKLDREYKNQGYDTETVCLDNYSGHSLRVSSHGTGEDLCKAVIFILNEVRDMINEAQNDR